MGEKEIKDKTDKIKAEILCDNVTARYRQIRNKYEVLERVKELYKSELKDQEWAIKILLFLESKKLIDTHDGQLFIIFCNLQKRIDNEIANDVFRYMLDEMQAIYDRSLESQEKIQELDDFFDKEER